MTERIYSLETEYGISGNPCAGENRTGHEQLFDRLRREVTARHGLPGCEFLTSGGKFHFDEGHAEWSLPECRSAREAAVYDKAADRILGQIVSGMAHTNEKRKETDPPILIVKNNVDTQGHTYGCHENYLARRETQWLDMETQLRMTSRYLIPFLVTRQVFCGSGRVGFGKQFEDGFGFQILQRADFLETAVSMETRSDRPIFHTGRENEPLGKGNFRRIHLISGDSNMSPLATWLKLGTTGILIQMVEDLHFGNIPHLADPVRAVRIVSRDPSLRKKIRLRNGNEMTAIDIQKTYIEQVQNYLSSGYGTAEEDRIVKEWKNTIAFLENDPEALFGKIDWITKKTLMDRFLETRGISWENLPKDRPERFDLLKMDIRYHDIHPETGLYNLVTNNTPEILFSEAEIRNAEDNPPEFTRAAFRGWMVRTARKTGNPKALDLEHWDRLTFQGRQIAMDDPLDMYFDDSRNPIFSFEQWRNMLGKRLNSESGDIRKRALFGLEQAAMQKNEAIHS